MPGVTLNHDSTPATVIVAVSPVNRKDGDVRCLVRKWPACEGHDPEFAPLATPEVVSIGTTDPGPRLRQLRLLVERNGRWTSSVVEADLDMVTVRNLLIWSGVKCALSVPAAESGELVEITFGSKAAANNNPSLGTAETAPAPIPLKSRTWAATEEQCKT